MATVRAVGRGGRLLGLRDGLRAREMLSCEESVDFIFKDLHSFSQNVSFGGNITQLGVFESKLFLTHRKSTLRQLEVKAALGQCRA